MLQGSSNEFGKISVTEDNTKIEWEVIRRYVAEAKEKNENPNYIYKIRWTPKKGLSLEMNKTQCAKNTRGVRNGLSSQFKQNIVKRCNNHKLKAMYTNADQFLKRDELVESITEVIPKAQLNPIEAPPPPPPLVGNHSHVNFDPSEANLGASGLCGLQYIQWKI